MKSIYQFVANKLKGRKWIYSVNNDSVNNKARNNERTSIYFEKINDTKIAKRIESIIDTKIWTIISIICTITSLLAYDFTIAFLPKNVDTSTDIILFIVLLFFLIEIICQSAFKKGYFLSFWFWLDFIAMISMVPDIVLLLNLFGIDSSDLNVSNTRASKVGKSGRSATALKAIRMIRFSRLFRVLRVFRFIQSDDESSNDYSAKKDVADYGSSKVGQIVSETVTKKVILLVLTLVLVLPWLEPNEVSFQDATESSSIFYEKLILNPPNNVDINEWEINATQEFVDTIPVPIIKITVANYNNTGNNKIFLNDINTIDKLRDIEMWELTLDRVNSDTKIIFNLRKSVYNEAGLGILLTLFAIFIFSTSTIFVTSSTMTLVVTPIARLTDLLMRMAGVIGLLGGASQVESLIEAKDELFIVEVLCNRIMTIFGGVNDGTNASAAISSSITGNNSNDYSNKSQAKAMNMMAARKKTEITSGDRIWEIDVKEKHRTSVIERKVHKRFKDFRTSGDNNDDIFAVNDDNNINTDILNNKEFFKKYSSLSSLDAIIENPITLYCLRMFMTSNLTVNNLLYCIEVNQFKQNIRSNFNSIYRKYIDDSSPAQINVSAKLFKEIKKYKEKNKHDNTYIYPILSNCFDDSRDETWKLMETNIYKQFIKSDYCRFYVHMRKNDPVTLNQLQLSVIDEENNKKPDQMIRSSEQVYR